MDDQKPPTERVAIVAEMERLISKIDDLEESSQTLIQRLQPVSRPPSQPESSGDSNTKQERASSSEHGTQISIVADRIGEITDRLRRAERRLEI